MCDVLDVSRSGYYEWRDRPLSARARRRAEIQDQAAKFHEESHEIYGYRKVHQDMVAAGGTCCAETVRRAMRAADLRSCIRPKWIATTDSDHDGEVVENLLDRDFDAENPNEKWVADITYIRTDEGWLYLAAELDLCNREVVGWAVSDRIDADLVRVAMENAIGRYNPGPGLLHHSDRGCQYTSDLFVQLLTDHGVLRSMSRKGNVWDNAVMERFFCSLKEEWIKHRRFKTRAEAEQSIFEYIEIFYNRQRRHACLDYMTPVEYRAHALRRKEDVA